MELRFLTLELT